MTTRRTRKPAAVGGGGITEGQIDALSQFGYDRAQVLHLSVLEAKLFIGKLIIQRKIMAQTDPKSAGKRWYAQYLLSDHWQQVSNEAVERAGGRCQLCNRKGTLQVHHRTYERVGKERPMDLIALCGACHKLFHSRFATSK